MTLLREGDEQKLSQALVSCESFGTRHAQTNAHNTDWTQVAANAAAAAAAESQRRHQLRSASLSTAVKQPDTPPTYRTYAPTSSAFTWKLPGTSVGCCGRTAGGCFFVGSFPPCQVALIPSPAPVRSSGRSALAQTHTWGARLPECAAFADRREIYNSAVPSHHTYCRLPQYLSKCLY